MKCFEILEKNRFFLSCFFFSKISKNKLIVYLFELIVLDLGTTSCPS